MPFWRVRSMFSQRLKHRNPELFSTCFFFLSHTLHCWSGAKLYTSTPFCANWFLSAQFLVLRKIPSHRVPLRRSPLDSCPSLPTSLDFVIISSLMLSGFDFNQHLNILDTTERLSEQGMFFEKLWWKNLCWNFLLPPLTPKQDAGHSFSTILRAPLWVPNFPFPVCVVLGPFFL